MDGRFLVAGRTSGRRAAELLVSVALSALQRCMRPVEHKKCIVGKVVHPVDPIVAGGARWAKLGGMGLHEHWIVLRMAFSAGGLVDMLQIG